jgi:hypothetical protein
VAIALLSLVLGIAGLILRAVGEGDAVTVGQWLWGGAVLLSIAYILINMRLNKAARRSTPSE